MALWPLVTGTVHLGALALALAAPVALPAHAAQDGGAPPRHLGDPAKLGLGVQRTMTLLATSTPSHRNTVRVLFYGQSITEQDWSRQVAESLRRRFPSADLVVENRALGGYSSQLLHKTAETDVPPFRPDLVIFHVYGAHDDYEQAIRTIRTRTAAEVLITTDHVTRDEDLAEETDPAKLQPEGRIWNSFMNYLWLPTVARKYGCGLAPVRDAWKQYLRETGTHAADYLADGVHLNERGCRLMAQLVDAYLVRRPEVNVDPMRCDTVRTWRVGRDVRWRDGRLKVTADGVHVDLVLKAGTQPARVLIDGRRASETPSLTIFTRALPEPGGKWPAILRVQSRSPLLVEDWTLKVTADPGGKDLFRFTLSGSKTGPDGEGRSDQPFVSPSGRVAVDPQDWGIPYALMLAGVKPVPTSLTIRWSAVPQFEDEVAPPAVLDPQVEHVVTVAQGLPGGPHTVEILGGPASPVAAVRVYRPGAPAER